MKSLKHVLMLLVAAGVLAAVLLTSVALFGSHKSNQAVQRAFVAKDVTADILPPPMYLIELRLVLSQAMEGTLTVDQARAEARRLKSEYDARVDHWKQHPPYGLEQSLFGQQHVAAESLFIEAQRVLDALSSGGPEAAQAPLKDAHAAYLRHRQGVDRTVTESLAFATDAAANFDSTQTEIAFVVGFVTILACAVLVAFGVWARRSVWAMTGGEPSEAAEIANAVARGDLSVRVAVTDRDSTSVMASMARMCASLSALVATVRHSSDAIAAGAAQISGGNADLSRRTEEQASGLQSTATSMDEISSTVKHNAENAREAAQLAKSASSVAARGGEVVGQVVTTMGRITASSKKVSDIVSVIDDIAFQTNILALNAAVEAARAGEQGRGFAVVAAEVQTLARRSADAAREIKTLIASSIDEIQQGSQLVTVAGTTMQDIVTQANKVAQLVNHITDAALQQDAGIEQVSSSVSKLDAATQQNSTLVQESAAAAEMLSDLAAKLVESVSVFKLARNGSVAGAPASFATRAVSSPEKTAESNHESEALAA